MKYKKRNNLHLEICQKSRKYQHNGGRNWFRLQGPLHSPQKEDKHPPTRWAKNEIDKMYQKQIYMSLIYFWIRGIINIEFDRKQWNLCLQRRGSEEKVKQAKALVGLIKVE